MIAVDGPFLMTFECLDVLIKPCQENKWQKYWPVRVISEEAVGDGGVQPLVIFIQSQNALLVCGWAQKMAGVFNPIKGVMYNLPDDTSLTTVTSPAFIFPG